MLVRIFLAGVLPALATSAALAQACPCGAGTRVVEPALTALLANRTVCGTAGNDSWQEFHSGANGGPLIDYKKGPQDPGDPSETVGTWMVSKDVVTYTYGGTNAYQFSVCQSGNTLNFCGAGRNVTGATLRAGQQSCSAGGALPLQQSPARSTTTTR